MTEKPRLIRIAIREPYAGWWQTVRRVARLPGRFVSAFVVRAIERYIADEPAGPPVSKTRLDEQGRALFTVIGDEHD